jgi:hypothetical protein
MLDLPANQYLWVDEGIVLVRRQARLLSVSPLSRALPLLLSSQFMPLTLSLPPISILLITLERA